MRTTGAARTKPRRGTPLRGAAPHPDGIQKARRFRRALLRWASSGKLRSFPWRHEADPYRVVLAEIMLARTKPSQVLPVYDRFFERFPAAEVLADAPRAAVADALYSLGLAWRADRIRDLAASLVERHGGRPPTDARSLEVLPGVGPYVAAMASALLGGRSAPAVDVNVARILCRVFGIRPRSEARRDRRVLEFAGLCHSRARAREYSLALIDLGALICLPRNPRCAECPIARARVCEYALRIE